MRLWLVYIGRLLTGRISAAARYTLRVSGIIRLYDTASPRFYHSQVFNDYLVTMV